MKPNHLVGRGAFIPVISIIVLTIVAILHCLPYIQKSEINNRNALLTNNITGIRQNDIDLAFEPLGVEFNESKVSFSVGEPIEGQETVISVNISNLGQVEIDVMVGFYDGPPIDNDIIGLYSVNLAPGHIEKVTIFNITDELQNHTTSANSDAIGNHSANMVVGHIKKVTASWNTTGEAENHTIFVVIDPDNLIKESNEDNNQVSKEIIVNQIPVADAGRDIALNEDQEIIFDGSGSGDTWSDMMAGLHYRWDFGDPYANFSNPNNLAGHNLTSPSHVYTRQGNYKVTLEVRDDGGAKSIDTMEVQVLNKIPIADAGNVRRVNEDDAVSFDGSGSRDTCSDMILGLNYRWTFGDPYANSSNPNIMEGMNLTAPRHIFTKEGNFSVTLEVRDVDGTKGLDKIQIEVVNVMPIASAEDIITAFVNETIDFDASNSTDTPSDMTTLQYFWDFGDNSTLAGIRVKHSYPENGTYNVTLRVIDDDRFESVKQIIVMIRDAFSVQGINLTFNLEKDVFSPNETIAVFGKVDINVQIHTTIKPIPYLIARIEFQVKETGTTWVTFSDREGHFSCEINAPGKPGDYTIVVTTSYGPLTSSVDSSFHVSPEHDDGAGPGTYVTFIVVGVVGTVSALGISIGSTEVGRYKFFSLLAPLYVKLKRDDVLNQFTRGKVYGFVVANPGTHYSEIRTHLRMKNGSLAYHLTVLEREGFVKSRREGIYKCFYSHDVKMPVEGQGSWLKTLKLDSDFEKIIDAVEEHPNLTQTQLVNLTALERSKVSRKVEKLIKENFVVVKQVGNLKFYRLDPRIEGRFRICPFCGKDMKIIVTPRYCPFCRRKLGN